MKHYPGGELRLGRGMPVNMGYRCSNIDEPDCNSLRQLQVHAAAGLKRKPCMRLTFSGMRMRFPHDTRHRINEWDKFTLIPVGKVWSDRRTVFASFLRPARGSLRKIMPVHIGCDREPAVKVIADTRLPSMEIGAVRTQQRVTTKYFKFGKLFGFSFFLGSNRLAEEE